FRICDLPKCIAKTSLPYREVSFNLVLTDPIAAYIPDDARWRGAGGEFRVTIGEESRSEVGRDAALPTLTASVGTFTRLWLGARTASSLRVTNGLQAPESLLQALDNVFRLPAPTPDWEF